MAEVYYEELIKNLEKRGGKVPEFGVEEVNIRLVATEICSVLELAFVV